MKCFLMSGEVNPVLKARSRTPIDEAGVRWWDLLQQNSDSETIVPLAEHKQVSNDNNEKFIHTEHFKTCDDNDDSTNIANTETEIFKDKEVKSKPETRTPKDIVLKKWRERQSKARYEQARRAIIELVKDKFEGQCHANLYSAVNTNRGDICKELPTIIVTSVDVKDTSNSNANRYDGVQANCSSSFVASEFKIQHAGDDSVGHARRLQMGPGGELAQWRLGARGSWAAGAEGGIRGHTRENMPVVYGCVTTPEGYDGRLAICVPGNRAYQPKHHN